jgi:hypothetical protein
MLQPVYLSIKILVSPKKIRQGSDYRPVGVGRRNLWSKLIIALGATALLESSDKIKLPRLLHA